MPQQPAKDDLDDFRKRCRERGLKVTPQRVLIYRELRSCTDHPSPETLFKRIQKEAPDMSLDTVYRALGTFCEMGLIDRVDGFGAVKRFDPVQTPHYHARCSVCHTIIDFECGAYEQLDVPAEVKKAFTVQRIRVTVEGLCKTCQPRKE